MQYLGILRWKERHTTIELGNRIKDLRKSQNINQDELAEKLFVSRQTISNWENDKSYPGIQSVLLLSKIFGVSVDQLLKGDVEKMERIITDQTHADTNKMNTYAKAMLISIIALLISTPILAFTIGFWFFIPFVVLFACTMYFATRIEKYKKEYNVQTYKEIVAFPKGEMLSEEEHKEELENYLNSVTEYYDVKFEQVENRISNIKDEWMSFVDVWKKSPRKKKISFVLIILAFIAFFAGISFLSIKISGKMIWG